MFFELLNLSALNEIFFKQMFRSGNVGCIWYKYVLFYAVIDGVIIHSIKSNIFVPDAPPPKKKNLMDLFHISIL